MRGGRGEIDREICKEIEGWRKINRNSARVVRTYTRVMMCTWLLLCCLPMAFLADRLDRDFAFTLPETQTDVVQQHPWQ